MQPLVSFCIPLYNGMKYLPELLDSLLTQIDDQAEIILCDDGSTDGTWELAQKTAQDDPRVKAYRNATNLGMDRNFHQSIKHASGQYIWLSGQDDVFGPQAYRTFLNILEKHPNTDTVYFNYRQLFDGPPKYYGETYLNIDRDYFFQGSFEYFKVIDHGPSFLPAIIMRKAFWDNTDVTPFYGTIWVQVGCWMMNCKDAKIYVVGDPTHIDCRCPLDSWKYHDGAMWFDLLAGDLYIYHYVHKHHPDYFPNLIYENRRETFIKNLPFNMVLYKDAGMEMGAKQRNYMRLIFRENSPLLYYFYILPLTHMPPWLAKIFRRIYTNNQGRRMLQWLRRNCLPFKAA